MNSLIHNADLIVLILTSIFLSTVSIYIYFQNRGSLCTRRFAMMGGCLVLWTLSTLFRVINPDPGLVVFSFRLSHATGSIAVTSVLYFSLLFPRETELSWPTRIILFSIGGFYAFCGFFTTLIVKDFIPSDAEYLYVGTLVGGPLHTSYITYGSGSLLLSIFASIYKFFHSRGNVRTQLALLTFSLLLSATASQVFTLILPRMGIMSFDSLGPAALFVSMSIIAFAIIRYRMFLVTPQVAAREIIDALGKDVLICDLKGNLIYDPIKNPVFERSPEIINMANLVVEYGSLKNHKINLAGKEIVASAFFFKEAGGGIIILFHDNTKIEQLIESEKMIGKQLQKRLDRERSFGEFLETIGKAEKITTIDAIEEKIHSSQDKQRAPVIYDIINTVRDNLLLIEKAKIDQVSIEAISKEKEKTLKEISTIEKRINLLHKG
ncbi:MAG: hypothetical protein KKH83_05585 [Candidatus Margulisbacteria bacterium]|nr:hypothetical protein [Candidatus Margulisiibacteriota bacterium]